MRHMSTVSKKHLFNIIGGCIIVMWLLMIGLLVRKTNFNKPDKHADFIADKDAKITSFQHDWMEIYLKGKKVGYADIHVSPVEEEYLIQEQVFLKLNLLGQANVIRTVTQSVADHQFRLKNFYFKMTSGVVSFRVSGKMEGNRMLLEIGEGLARRNESIVLSEKPVIGGGIALFFKDRRLEVGDSFMFPVFDPSTMAQRNMVLRVEGKETLVINRIEYKAIRLAGEMLGQGLTFWLDERGNVLKQTGFMGLTLVKSSVGRASKDIDGGGGDDFYELAAIGLNRQLPKSNRLTYLKLEVEGLNDIHFDKGILNRERQSFSSGVLEITKEKVPLTATYSLPYSDDSSKMKSFLQPELNIESDHKEIRDKALEIARNSKNPILVAKRLKSWVYKNLRKQPVLTVPGALEVLNKRIGDCNEHSVLLTALLRASGIPARVCVGLVYVRGGFYYHAWTEGYLGEWVSVDATLNQMPADATHIKLVEGGLRRQVEIINLIGKVGFKVIDYGYD
jgi:hypothetical protein